MRTYTCILADDEPHALEIMETFAKRCPDLEIKSLCSDSMEALRDIELHRPDIIFLDINMPQLSGISLVKSLDNPPLIIFTTAYPEYAVEGFELNAVDYLLKPFAFERFLKAYLRAIEILDNRTKEPVQQDVITVKAGKKIYKLTSADIYYIEGCGDYIKIQRLDSTLVVHDTIKNIEKKLPAGAFLRIHKSYIINLRYIEYLEGNRIRVDNKFVPIGQTYKNKLLERLG